MLLRSRRERGRGGSRALLRGVGGTRDPLAGLTEILWSIFLPVLVRGYRLFVHPGHTSVHRRRFRCLSGEAQGTRDADISVFHPHSLLMICSGRVGKDKAEPHFWWCVVRAVQYGKYPSKRRSRCSRWQRGLNKGNNHVAAFVSVVYLWLLVGIPWRYLSCHLAGLSLTISIR